MFDRELAEINDRVGVQKRGPVGPLEMGKERSTELTFEVKDDASEVRFIEDLLAFCGAKKKSTTAEVVDLASDALGVIVNASQETITKDRALASRDAQVVFDIACGFFEVEGLEMEADGDALVEGFVGGEAELVSEVRLAK